jgi:hypothetical protein
MLGKSLVGVAPVGPFLQALLLDRNGCQLPFQGVTSDLSQSAALFLHSSLRLFSSDVLSFRLDLRCIPATFWSSFLRADRQDLKNYRPLSIMSVDYKILTEIMMRRLVKALSPGIGMHQSPVGLPQESPD